MHHCPQALGGIGPEFFPPALKLLRKIRVFTPGVESAPCHAHRLRDRGESLALDQKPKRGLLLLVETGEGLVETISRSGKFWEVLGSGFIGCVGRAVTHRSSPSSASFCVNAGAIARL